MRRILLLLTGWLAVALATAGVVLPLLPTTPFLLVAAWCFARSSPRFHNWLLYRSWFGGYLRCWQNHRAMPPGVKPRAGLVVIITFAVSIWLLDSLWLRALLMTLMIALLGFLWRIPVFDATQQKP